MTSLASSSAPVSSLTADALVVGVDSSCRPVAHPLVSQALLDALAGPAAALDAAGTLGTTTVLPGAAIPSEVWEGGGYGRIVLVGIGDGGIGDLRYAAGAAARACGKQPRAVVLALAAKNVREYSAVAEGAVLGAYTYTDYKTDVDLFSMVPTRWIVAGASDESLARATVLAEAIAGVRDLVNTPPSDLYPASFAAAAERLAGEHGCAVEVWDEQRLEEEGYGGILGVGKGSSRPPRLVRVAWEPAGATQTVALVGKGITFDTGGISLKPPKSMETMKGDMAGAAAVLHVVAAAARAGLGIGVTGWLCLAENMPSGTAQRPSDVLRTYQGTTVEVLNTDAEGRLVLADGLARAVEEQPDLVIDVATLTGAQGMALGTRTSAVMGTDDARTEVIDAAGAVDEAMWPMPLPSHLREGLTSKIADLQNIGESTGGMLSAGLFLKEFVGQTPWAHLDIARPAFNEGSAFGFTVPGGTGASVLTLFEVLERRAR